MAHVATMLRFVISCESREPCLCSQKGSNYVIVLNSASLVLNYLRQDGSEAFKTLISTSLL